MMPTSHEMIPDSNVSKASGQVQDSNKEIPSVNYGPPPYPVPYGYQNYYPYPATPDFQISPPLDPTLPYVYVPYPVPQYNDIQPSSSSTVPTSNGTAMSNSTSAGHNMSPSLSGNSSTPSSPQSHPLSPGAVRPIKNRRYPRQPRPPYTTNVYIHGLPPTTTDEALYNMCSAYGMILSSKSIIDPKTQTCRGYGFVMYEHLHQAQHAIYCLGVAGFEASFAKVRSPTFVPDFRPHLPPHAKSQDQSSNLYLTNLPLDYTEEKLEELFAPYQVLSVRIMRDQQQQSRGVGFARMPDRASAQAALDALDGVKMSQEPLKIKFADVPNSKRPRNFSQHAPHNYTQGPHYPDDRGYNYGYPPCYALGYAYPPYGFPGGFYPGMTYYPNPMNNPAEDPAAQPASSYPDVDELSNLVRDNVNISDPLPVETSSDRGHESSNPSHGRPSVESHSVNPVTQPSPNPQETYPIPSRVPVA